MSTPAKTTRSSTWREYPGFMIPALAFIIQGGWTLAVNWPAGINSAILSALAQGLISATSTFLMGVIMLAVFRFIIQDMIAFIMSILASSLPLLGALVVVHKAVGTAYITKTMILPGTAIILYAVIYSFQLYQLRRRTRQT